MSSSPLRDRVAATLNPNASIRQQAELELRHAEEQPGFLNALLDILDVEQAPEVRQGTVIILKNRVSKGWDPVEDHTSSTPITEDEKVALRQRLIPLLVSSPPQIKAQLIPTLQKILSHDFPAKWPEFLDHCIQLLSGNDAAQVFAGTQCLLAICRVFRFKSGEERAQFEPVVPATFPLLLNLGNRIVNEDGSDAGEIMRTIMKTYKHAIYMELPHALREHQAMVGWCTLFLTLISKTPPPCSMEGQTDEREVSHWWKAKKWAYTSLNRMFVRYGNPGSLTKIDTDEYAEVAKLFIVNFAPEILKVYLQVIERWVKKEIWLSKGCLSHTLAYLDECIKPKSMWALLKPHMETLISHLMFPVLCQSEEDLEMFTEEPQEYLHRKLNFYEEVGAPDVAATNFLINLTKNRRKQTFTVLQFVNNIVNNYESAPDDQKNPREKEGALRMIGTLAPVILSKKSPIQDQVELFFVRHVFPEFRSPYGFLRARACETLEKFEKLDFKDPNNLLVIYRNILESMNDPELPVRVEAALALQPLIRHEPIRAAMQTGIPTIMQQLLKLANEVDIDSLANVMEDFVEVFAQELTPFAVALCEQLRDTYLRIVRELLEKNATKGEDDDQYDYMDDKSIAALGVLQTIGTLILTLESTPDVLLHLETILMPVIEITLSNKLYDLYNEVFEIIDSCTFAAKQISPTMWHAFELIHLTFKAGAELYLEDMLPALENFINYGDEALKHSKPHLDAFVDMVRTNFHDDKVGGVDRICGCKLAEALMLAIRGHIDEYVPEFIQLAIMHLSIDEVKAKTYKVHLMEMVINAVYYNPRLAIQTLEQQQWTNKFFSMWFSSIDLFTRVHDKKLSIVAIVALLSLQASEIPISVQQGWPRLLQGIVRLFQTLPTAMKNREEATNENNYDVSGGDYEDEEDDEWENQADWEEADGEEVEELKDESAAYLEFLSEEAQKYNVSNDDDDIELEEESLLETPLDKIEPYSLFKSAIITLQQQQPDFYTNLTHSLSPEEQQVLQSAVNQADTIEAQASAAALAAGVQVQSPHQEHTNGHVLQQQQ